MNDWPPMKIGETRRPFEYPINRYLWMRFEDGYSMLPTDNYAHKMTSKVENGYEIIEIRFCPDDLYLLKIISSVDKESYKLAMCDLCYYPRSEVGRIKDIVPRQDGEDWVVTVTFRNPGKQFEEYMKAVLADGGNDKQFQTVIGISDDALSYLRG